MKQLLLLILLSLFLRPAFSQEQSKFDDLKTGKFAYENKVGEVEIIRTKRKQIEQFNDGESKLILKIKWVSASDALRAYKLLIPHYNRCACY